MSRDLGARGHMGVDDDRDWQIPTPDSLRLRAHIVGGLEGLPPPAGLCD